MAAKINTFVFFNIGKNGLDYYNDSRQVKICAKAVTREEFRSDRNVNIHSGIKLFCFEPLPQDGGQSLLDCDLSFDEDEKERFIEYLSRFTAPVALVAFNGYRFQFPILREAIGKLPGILCVDLLDAIYELENYLGPPEIRRDCSVSPPNYCRPVEDKMSYKFPDVYERMMEDFYPNHTHGMGENGLVLPNMKMWIECAVYMWRSFIRWSDVNATRFNRVMQMELLHTARSKEFY